MTQEEKAKAYDEAYKKVAVRFGSNVADEIFLKESEDERIRKEIMDIIDSFEVAHLRTAGLPTRIPEYLAWLEKAGDYQKQIAFAYRKGLNDGARAVERPNEQKPTDNVEPKFKVGDVMRTRQEAADGIKDGLPVVVSIDDTSYHCTNETIDIKDQEDYEYPPMNRKKNPAWSEEDKAILEKCIGAVKVSCYSQSFKSEAENWLKSLKGRVKPQPKQEWKQENTGDLTDFENAMMCVGESFFGKYAGLDPNDTNAIKGQANLLLELVSSKDWSEEEKARIDKIVDVLDWAEEKGYIRYSDWEDYICYIKSLKGRYTWKPSDEQIKAIKWIIDGDNPENWSITLENLYQDLKKQIEE